MLTWLVLGGDALAKKPPKPPPEPPPDHGGVLYYAPDRWNGPVFEIRSDGSGQRELEADLRGGAEPSLHLHPDPEAAVEGEPIPQARWFLQEELADGIEQLYAISENGTEHRLYADTSLQAGGAWGDYLYPRWSDGDRLVAFCATRLDEHGQPVADESGLYLLALDPDTMTATGSPVFAPLPSHVGDGAVARNLQPDLTRDGAFVAYKSWNTYAGLWCADVADVASAERLVEGVLWNPRWSPDGSWIAYVPGSGIDVIRPDGTDRATLVPDPDDRNNTRISAYGPCWAPSGDHMAYVVGTKRVSTGARTRFYPETFTIWIVGADGSSPTELREGFVLGWR